MTENVYEIVIQHINQTNDIETLKKMLLDTLDNAKNSGQLFEEIYDNYLV